MPPASPSRPAGSLQTIGQVERVEDQGVEIICVAQTLPSREDRCLPGQARCIRPCSAIEEGGAKRRRIQIDFCKKVANCTNNKDVILCILRHHMREGHLQYLQKLQADLPGEEDSEEVMSQTRAEEEWLARNDSISCELGIW